MDFDPRWSDDPRERDDYGLRAEAFAAVGSSNRADQIIRKGNARRRHDAGILETFRRSNDHHSSCRRGRTEQSLEMLNCLARHVAGERTVTKLAQTLRQACDRYRAKEPQHIERVFVLQPSRLSFPAPIGKLMQLGHE